jgi:hypothetical protein
MPQDKINITQAQRELLKYVKKKKCVLFIGAGIHAPPPEESPYSYPEKQRPPLGGDLAEILAEECGFKEKFKGESFRNLQRVSLCYETTLGLGRKSLVDSLKKYLKKGKEPSPALKMLAHLPFRIFVTTNYDRLLESALRECGKDPTVFVYNPRPHERVPDVDEDPTAECPLVFKMHGDLGHSESIVITDEDYITFVQRMYDKEKPVPETVSFRMTRWPTIFVGYSLLDYNLRLLFRTLRWKLDTAEFPVSFSVDKKPDDLIKEVWQNKRGLISFIAQDIWAFVPWLYKEIQGEEYKK